MPRFTAALLAIGLAAHPSLYAAPADCSGRVRSSSGTVLQGASVRLLGTPSGSITNRDGFFRVATPAVDSVTLVTSMVGHISDTLRLPASSHDVEITLVERSVIHEALIVTAVRAGASDAVAQTTIDAARLRDLHAGQDPPFLLEQATPSLVAASESGTNFSNYGTFRIRGIDQTRVNITLNGAPLNDMIDQGVFFSNLTDIGNSISTMQVQRGVGTSSNGTASYAGSINFESVDLSEARPSASVQLSAGSFNLVRASAELSTGRMENNVSAHVRVTTFDTDGYRRNSGTTSTSLFATAAWYGTKELVKFTGFMGRTNNQLAYIAVPGSIAEGDPRTNLNDSNDRDDFGQQFAQLQYVRELSPTVSLAASAYYGGAGGDFFVTFPGDTELEQINYPLRNDHVGIQTVLHTTAVLPGLDITGGLHAYSFFRRNFEQAVPDLSSPYYDDRTRKNELSAFAKASWTHGRLRVLAEAQLRAVGMKFTPDARTVDASTSIPTHVWTFLNPRLGAEATLAPWLTGWASFGRTHREPTRFDMLGSTQINTANLNVLLKPGTIRHERVDDLEAGLRLATQDASIHLTAFHMMFTDEIAPIGQFIEQQFVQLRKNVASSTRTGVEVESMIRLAEPISLRLGGTVMRARISEFIPDNSPTTVVYRNVQPILTPTILANGGILVAILPTLSLDLSARHIGQQWLDITNRPGFVLPASTIVDARVTWTVVQQATLSVRAFNLLDERYATNGGISADGTEPAWFVQPPRSFIAMVELRL
jgi:iron complex outermembrane recepter protein